MDTKQERLGTLAASLEHLTEGDFCALAGITPGTAEAWRKRARGPRWIRIGNTILYPRAEVQAHLRALLDARQSARSTADSL